MPTYQYACTACDHEFEAIQSFSDDSLTKCPQCQGEIRKVYTAVGDLQDEFKILLVRTYAGALAQVSHQTIVMKPLRSAPEDKEVMVRTEVKGRGDPIQLDYRLEKTPGVGAGWKIYNLNVMGVWLVETYRSQFAQQIGTKGVDGLIDALTEQNKANAQPKKG